MFFTNVLELFDCEGGLPVDLRGPVRGACMRLSNRVCMTREGEGDEEHVHAEGPVCRNPYGVLFVSLGIRHLSHEILRIIRKQVRKFSWCHWESDHL